MGVARPGLGAGGRHPGAADPHQLGLRPVLRRPSAAVAGPPQAVGGGAGPCRLRRGPGGGPPRQGRGGLVAVRRGDDPREPRQRDVGDLGPDRPLRRRRGACGQGEGALGAGSRPRRARRRRASRRDRGRAQALGPRGSRHPGAGIHLRHRHCAGRPRRDRRRRGRGGRPPSGSAGGDRPGESRRGPRTYRGRGAERPAGRRPRPGAAAPRGRPARAGAERGPRPEPVRGAVAGRAGRGPAHRPGGAEQCGPSRPG